jgi:hypothetical protein
VYYDRRSGDTRTRGFLGLSNSGQMSEFTQILSKLLHEIGQISNFVQILSTTQPDEATIDRIVQKLDICPFFVGKLEMKAAKQGIVRAHLGFLTHLGNLSILNQIRGSHRARGFLTERSTNTEHIASGWARARA